MTTPEQPAPAPPRLGVLTATTGRDDSLRRELVALAAAGFDVVLVAAADGTRIERSALGDVRIERLPLRWLGSQTWRAARARRRRWRPSLGFRAPELERAAYARVAARELALPSSPRPRQESVFLGLRRGLLGTRRLLVRGAARGVRLAWRSVDPVLSPAARRGGRAVHEDDLELAFGAAVDRLQCDVLLADTETAGVAARAAARTVGAGRAMAWVLDRRGELAAQPGDRAGAPRVARYATAHVGPGASFEVLTAALATAASATAAAAPLPARPRSAPERLVERPWVPPRDASAPPLLGIGPANMAGQAWAWAKAVERERPDVRTEVLMVDRGSPLLFPADETVTTATYGRDVAWQERTRERILSTWSHALIEAGRPLMGVLHGRTFAADAALMQQAGVTVGLVFHGSELRDPRRHAANHRWSPFRDADDEWVRKVQATVDLVRPAVDAFEGPCLVSTPDLLEDLPRAVWLPVVVDTSVWTPHAQREERAVPVVVHTPSRAAIKGSDFVDAAVAPLADAGLVEYRRIEGVPPDQMPDVLAQADIVLDQFAIASYGVLACQAMASGIAVVGHVSDSVRGAVRDAAGIDLAVVEADAETLGGVLRELVADRERLAAAAAAGPPFVDAVHGGRRSAEVLVETLGLPAE